MKNRCNFFQLKLFLFFLFLPLVSLEAEISSVDDIPVKQTGDAFSADEFNSIIDAIRGIRHDNNDTFNDKSDDKFGIGGVTSPSEMLDVNGNVKADFFLGDGSQLTNLPAASFWEINGSDELYYNAGNVGIGTNNPATLLQVSDTTSTTAKGYRVTARRPVMQFQESDTTNQNWQLETAGGKFYFMTQNDAFNSSGIRMTLLQNGNVGIGTTNPAYDLDLTNTGVIRAGTVIADNLTTSGGSSLIPKWKDGAVVGQIYYEDGNVGIGTDDPANNALQINTNSGQSSLQFTVSNNDVNSFSLGVDGSDGHKFKIADSYNLASSTWLTIDQSGRMGLGTSFPTEELQVSKSQAAPTTIGVVNTSASSNTNTRAGVNVTANAGSGDLLIFGSNASGSYGSNTKADSMFLRSHSGNPVSKMVIGNGAAVPIHFTTSDTNRMTILGNGNVGVGTSSPTHRFHVRGGPIAVDSNSDGNRGYVTDANGFGIGLVGDLSRLTNPDIYVTGDGDVGVGTMLPSEKLDVNGNVIADNFIKRDGSPIGGQWTLSGSNIYRNIGNVGIGTTSPSEKLHLVGGDARIGGSGGTIAGGNADNGSLVVLGGGTLGLDGNEIYFENQGNIGTIGQNDLNFNINGSSNAIKIKGNSGRVGIGTTAPAYDLDVAGELRATTGVRIGTTGGRFFSDSTNRIATDSVLYVRSNSPATYLYSTNTYLGASSGDRTHLRGNNFTWNQGVIQGNGNVGIGTTNPGRRLDVGGTGAGDVVGIRGSSYNQLNIAHSGNASWGLLLTNSGAASNTGYHYSTSGANNSAAIVNVNNDALHLGTGNSPRMTISHNGNIGIGTLSPSAKLDVVGNTEINGQIIGGMGAVTTSGTQDWNHNTNARSGNGYTLLTGNMSNGPDGSGNYYHPFSFEYNTKNGTGNMTQFAIPYLGGDVHFRSRYSGTWQPWKTLATKAYVDASSGIWQVNPSTDNVYYNGGNVGIGTSVPQEEFQINKNQGAPTAIAITNGSSSTNQNTRSSLNLATNGAGMEFSLYGSSASGSVGSNTRADSFFLRTNSGAPVSKMVIGNGGAVPIHFTTTDTNRMTIAGNGNVGIGTTSPNGKFEVYGGHGDAKARIYSTGNGSTLNASLDMWASEPGVTYDGSGLGNNVNGHPYYGRRNTSLGQSYMRFQGGNIMLSTGAGNASEKLRIQDNGNVGIGTTSPSQRLDVVGNAEINGEIRGITKLSFDQGTNYRIDTNSSGLIFDGGDGSADFLVYDNSLYTDVIRTGYTGTARITTYDANEDLRLDANGSGAVYVADNLGVYTASPSEELQVDRNQANPTTALIRNVSTSTNTNTRAGVSVVANGSQTDFMTYGSNASGSLGGTSKADATYIRSASGAPVSKMVIGNGGAVPLYFITGDTIRQTISAGGNVGIGTTAPTARLHVAGNIISNNPTASNHVTTKAYVDSAVAANSGVWNVNGSSVYYNSGNVGIGTASPGAKLQIDGGTNTEVRVVSDDNGNSTLSLYGVSQGTGRVYVGQSSTYGGGIEYNGDNSPVTSGAGADYIALYRRAAGTNQWTARNYYSNNDWDFRGSLRVRGGNVRFGTGNQVIYGDNSSAYYVDSAHGSIVQQIFRDNEDDVYGRVYGSGNGTNFGLLDGDGNWAIQSVKDNNINFRVNNSEKMRILTSGNVGIGTSNPAYRLHVNGIGVFEGDIVSGGSNSWMFHTPDDGRRTLYFGTASSTGGTRSWPIAFGSDGRISATAPTASNHLTTKAYVDNAVASNSGVWQVNGNQVYYNGGYVGIGTSNPTAPLDILTSNVVQARFRGTGNTYNYVESAGTGYARTWYRRNNAWSGSIGADRNGNFTIASGASDSNHITINSSGNVGIGTTSPSQKLHVAGSALITGDNFTSNFGTGAVGNYSPTRYQHVWGMGAAYRLPTNGLDESGPAGNFYGLAWSYNPNYSYSGSNPQAKAGLGHQMLLMSAGTTRTALGTGVWTAGNFVGDHLYARNNTTYKHISGGTGSTNGANILMYGGSAGANTNDMHLRTGGTSRVVIDGGGNVGVGTAPTVGFDVNRNMKINAPSGSYDVWIQGGTASSGDNRNLALLGLDEDSGDKLIINYGNEYASGAEIQSNLNVTGRVSAASPTASNHLTTKSYVDTAVSANSGVWDVSGTNVYYNAGNVGIGTSSPSQKLDIVGNAEINGNITNLSEVRFASGGNHSIGSNASGLVFDGGDGTADFLVYDNSIYTDVIRAGYSGTAQITTYNSGEDLMLTSNGARVRVNDDMYINGYQEIINTSPTIRFSDTNNDNFHIHTNSDRLYFMNDDNNNNSYDDGEDSRIVMFNSGGALRLGIGVTSPSYNLDVRGTAYSSGVARFDGGVQVDGRQMISSSGYVHTARSTTESRYGYFQGVDNDGTRGFYLGYGNGASTVDLRLDSASQLTISGGNTRIDGNLIINNSAQAIRTVSGELKCPIVTDGSGRQIQQVMIGFNTNGIICGLPGAADNVDIVYQ